MKQKRLTQTLLAAITSFGLIGGAYAAEERSYILATASTGGTYYPVGVALATLTKVKLTPSYHFSLSAISSAGSGENVKLMNDNEAQFAILQGLYGAWAWAGEGPYAERQNQLRSVSMLWQNVEHFIVRSDLAPTGTIADLASMKGKKFSIGSKNSGTEFSGRQIMKGVGVDPDTFNLAYLGYGGSASALQNGTIDGMNTPAGVPVGAVTQAFAAMGNDIKILSLPMSRSNKPTVTTICGPSLIFRRTPIRASIKPSPPLLSRTSSRCAPTFRKRMYISSLKPCTRT